MRALKCATVPTRQMSEVGQQFASGDEAIRVCSAPEIAGSAFTPGIGATADVILPASIGTYLANNGSSILRDDTLVAID